MINTKGDPEIINRLQLAIRRRDENDNPVLTRPKMYFDFNEGRIRVAPAPGNLRRDV